MPVDPKLQNLVNSIFSACWARGVRDRATITAVARHLWANPPSPVGQGGQWRWSGNGWRAPGGAPLADAVGAFFDGGGLERLKADPNQMERERNEFAIWLKSEDGREWAHISAASGAFSKRRQDERRADAAFGAVAQAMSGLPPAAPSRERTMLAAADEDANISGHDTLSRLFLGAAAGALASDRQAPRGAADLSRVFDD